MSSNDNKAGNEGYNRAFISFAIKTIRNGSFNYFRKSSKHWKRESLCLDEATCTIQQTNPETDFIVDDEFEIGELDFSCIENIVSDRELFKIIKRLTGRQKEILYYVCIERNEEKIVAAFLGITQQAVNNTKHDALKKIRRNLEKPPNPSNES